MSVNLFLVLFLLFNFSAQAAEVCQADRPKPLPPSNIYEIAQTTSRDDGVHRAFIPAFGTTRDGRIGLAKLANNPQSNQTGLNFFLLKPELVNGDFHRRPDGKPLLMVDYDNLNAVTRRISISQLRNKYGNSVIPSRNLMHTVICDHRRFKPHNLNNQDEYQFKVIAFEPDTNADRDVTAWTFGVRVRVKDPKTSRAEIDSIVLDDNYQKKVMKGLRVGLEPSITSDGKLMIVRTPLRYSYNPNPWSLGEEIQT